MLAQQLDL